MTRHAMTREPTIDHRSTDTRDADVVAPQEASAPNLVRRRLLAWTAAMPLAACVNLRAYAQAAGGNLPKVTPDDPAAKALGYVEDASTVDTKTNPTFKAGNTCATCMLYQAPATEPWGPCTPLPGKLVSATGWCRVWVKKP